MEKNKKIIKLCYLQIAFYVVFLTSLLPHFKRGLDHRAFALLIILTLLGCASALTLTDYLKSLIRRSGFDVAGVHDKKSLEEKLLQLQNTDDTLDVGVMMFDMNNLKMINDTYGHEEGDVFIQTFASYLTRILTEDSFLARFGGDEFVIVQNHATWNQLEQMNLQLQTMIDTYNQTADHPLSYAVGYELSCNTQIVNGAGYDHCYVLLRRFPYFSRVCKWRTKKCTRTSGIKNSSRKTDLSPPAAVCLLRAFPRIL